MKRNIRLDETAAGHRKKKVDCPYCRKRRTWTRYYDFDRHQYLPVEYGRCDRENSCGKFVMPPMTRDDGTMTRISRETMLASIAHYDENSFVRWLRTVTQRADELCRLYNVGTAKLYNGGAIFWQVDKRGQVRSGKVIGYGPDGRRVKGQTNWAHTMLRLDNFELEQCFFGEHLLKDRPDAPVYMVESEKTAILLEAIYPGEFVALACGSSNGMGGRVLNREKCRPLIGREVILFPDASSDGQTAAHWQQIAEQMNEVDIFASCNPIDDVLVQEHRDAGLDIGDCILPILLRYYPSELQQHEQPEKDFYFPF